MFWWRHTGPREALLTCSEILKFSQNIYKSSQKYSHPPPSCWWLNSRKSKPQVTTQHFTNEFPRIPRDKWGVNQPSLSIKSQLIIKSCWAGIIRSPAVTSTLGTRHHFPPAQTDVWVRTEEGAESGERSWAARQLPACSARWRIDWLGGPEPFTITDTQLKAGFTVETQRGNSLSFLFFWLRSEPGNLRPRSGQTEPDEKDNLLGPNLFITKIKL